MKTKEGGACKLLARKAAMFAITLSNVIVLLYQIENFDSDVVLLPCFVELNSRITFGTAEARRMNWALAF